MSEVVTPPPHKFDITHCTMLLLDVVKSMYEGSYGAQDVIMRSYIRSRSRSTLLLLTRSCLQVHTY